MANYKHLIESERKAIEQFLRKGRSLKAIARLLDRSPSTISREIQRNSTVRPVGAFNVAYNPCQHRYLCDKRNLCPDSGCKKSFCQGCKRCNQMCSDFQRQNCHKLQQPPYTCLGCSTRRSCSLEKSDYLAKNAQRTASNLLSESRSGILLSEQARQRLDDLVTPLIKKGQSIYHISQTHQDEIMLSSKTLYRYINMGILGAKRMDLPRAVRYRPRKKKRPLRIERDCFKGRTHDDFLAFLAKHPDLPVVEIDSVEGTKGGKVMLTVFFREATLTLSKLRTANDAASVTAYFNDLYEKLGRELYCKLFPVILADRGSEFTNPSALEFDSQGRRKSYVFFCDPQAPWQKGALENAHELIRKVLPKGVSFDSLSQVDCYLILDHVNAYKRKKLNGKSAYDTFSFLHGEEVLRLLGCHFVQPDEVHLLPSLLED